MADIHELEHFAVYVPAVGRQFCQRSVPTSVAIIHHDSNLVDGLLDRQAFVLENGNQVKIDT